MANKAKKIPHIKPINNFAMLFVLSIFQLITGFEAASAHNDFSTKAMLANIALIALEWVYVSLLYIIVHRRNFELAETASAHKNFKGIEPIVIISPSSITALP